MSKEPVYAQAEHELHQFTEDWLKKWKDSTYLNPSYIERIFLDNLYSVHNEVWNKV
jgi:hypothetical protein